jgi:cell division protein FtsW
VGSVSFQPSELAKLTTVMMLAGWLTRAARSPKRFVDGLLKPGLALGMILGLILIEPDYGTTALVAAVAGVLLYVGGCRLWQLALGGAGGVAVLAFGIMHDPERKERILAFLFPDRYPEAYYQLGQSIDAFMLGGPLGVGLGESLQKHYYLPEAHTDFILAIVGEELGMVATIGVLVLFALYLAAGTIISLRAPDLHGRLLGFGLTLMVVLQAALNVGVVTGCLPTKGLPLPFISYGGSSVLMSLAGVGILLNIARHAVAPDADVHTRAVQDSQHWV